MTGCGMFYYELNVQRHNQTVIVDDLSDNKLGMLLIAYLSYIVCTVSMISLSSLFTCATLTSRYNIPMDVIEIVTFPCSDAFVEGGAKALGSSTPTTRSPGCLRYAFSTLQTLSRC